MWRRSRPQISGQCTFPRFMAKSPLQTNVVTLRVTNKMFCIISSSSLFDRKERETQCLQSVSERTSLDEYFVA